MMRTGTAYNASHDISLPEETIWERERDSQSGTQRVLSDDNVDTAIEDDFGVRELLPAEIDIGNMAPLSVLEVLVWEYSIGTLLRIS